MLYFEEDSLKDTIVLDVQWFVDSFKCILEYPVDIEKGNDMERIQFYTTGELDDKDLDMIWSKPENKMKGFQEHKRVLMSYMEKLGLLAVCDFGQRPWYYFPCMNRRKFDIEHNRLKKLVPSSILCFQFAEEKQLPIFLFYNLVVKCLKMIDWKILIEEQKQYSCIYDDAACFSYRKHIVLLCICNFQIQVQVCHPSDTIEPSVLREIRIALGNRISEFEKYSFQVGYKCRNGAFHKEEDIGFIPEKEFPVPVDNQLCNNCGLKTHFVDSKICWVTLFFILIH